MQTLSFKMVPYDNRQNSIRVIRKNRMRPIRLTSQSSFDMNVSMAREEGKAGFRIFSDWLKLDRLGLG